ncbi:MAG: hypothetical protein F6K42_26890 [Leptolyngbya sp. SIO1D8]|nr:hypothetical protein [Leptolyngbya sp. SIO1D8]
MNSPPEILTYNSRLEEYCKALSLDENEEDISVHAEILWEIFQVLNRDPLQEDFNEYNEYIKKLGRLFFYLAYHPNRDSWLCGELVVEAWTRIAELVGIIQLQEPRHSGDFYSILLKARNTLKDICEITCNIDD